MPGGTHAGTGIADWPFIYGHLATATGWTLTEIGELTLWDVSDLFGYWQENPPTHVLVAAYLGLGRSKLSRNNSRGKDSFEELAQAVIAAGGSVNKKLPALYRG